MALRNDDTPKSVMDPSLGVASSIVGKVRSHGPRTVQIDVMGGTDLDVGPWNPMQLLTSNNPYVRVQLGCSAKSAKSMSVKCSNNPKWDFSCTFEYNGEYSIEFKVGCERMMVPNLVVGFAKELISKVCQGWEGDVTLYHDEAMTIQKGVLHVKVSWPDGPLRRTVCPILFPEWVDDHASLSLRSDSPSTRGSLQVPESDNIHIADSTCPPRLYVATPPLEESTSRAFSTLRGLTPLASSTSISVENQNANVMRDLSVSSRSPRCQTTQNTDSAAKQLSSVSPRSPISQTAQNTDSVANQLGSVSSKSPRYETNDVRLAKRSGSESPKSPRFQTPRNDDRLAKWLGSESSKSPRSQTPQSPNVVCDLSAPLESRRYQTKQNADLAAEGRLPERQIPILPTSGSPSLTHTHASPLPALRGFLGGATSNVDLGTAFSPLSHKAGEHSTTSRHIGDALLIENLRRKAEENASARAGMDTPGFSDPFHLTKTNPKTKLDGVRIKKYG
eukprot:GEMP01018214.1.p1 GENE.GEMP01018214.1~~GEMP01018214.1.p1  ORF type:complete len:503 (+),score=45.39 GEMP01018214.1:267-1775(+)